MAKLNRKTMFRQSRDTLYAQYSKGRNMSRHEAKAQKGSTAFGERKSDYIHSKASYDKYTQTAKEFLNWCVHEKGVDMYTNLKALHGYAEQYLEYRNEQGFSKATIKTDRAGLGRLLDITVPFNQEYKGSVEVTRSRGNSARDERFSHKHNQDLVNVCKGTGGRRSDIQKLKKKDFKEINGRLYVTFEKSKGGKTRTSPVLPEFESEIKNFIENMTDNQKLFETVNDSADIHSFRRDYAQKLYNLVSDESNGFKENLTRDLRIQSRKIMKAEREIKSDMYHARGSDFKGKRDDIYLVSLALGHNRLDTSIVSYLT